MEALGGMGVGVEGYVALGDHKIDNGRAQELWRQGLWKNGNFYEI